MIPHFWCLIHFRVPALCPSKSGLMNKHIVKHIGIWDLYWSLRVNDPFLGVCPVPV